MSLGDSIQFIFLIILLPYMSKVLLARNKSARTKDLRLAVTSMVTLSIGFLLLGLGPRIWVAVIGTYLILIP